MEEESTSTILSSNEIAEKIFELAEQFHRYSFVNPEVLDAIPNNAILVFLDETDPAFNSANIRLAKRRKEAAESGVVYINMKMSAQTAVQADWQAEIVSDWSRLPKFEAGTAHSGENPCNL